ncbi:MAG: CoA transferase [Dehalococcoidales bacterium]|nr:CoA transferase [Dehalococcoidales bacterium]
MGPINSAKEIMENEQYAARNYFVTVNHPEAGKYQYAGWPYQMAASPPCVCRPSPLLGQHNQEVFCDVLGYSPIKLRRLQRSGAILPHSGEGPTNRKRGK